MKKLRHLSLLLMVFFLASIAAVNAQDYPTYSAQKVDAGHAVTIDAWFDEWADYGEPYTIEDWNEEGAYTVPDSPEDLTAEYKMAWDDDFLYMYFYVLDEFTSTSNTEEPWQNDGIEIAFVMMDDTDNDLRAAYNMFWQPETQHGSILQKANESMGDVTIHVGSGTYDFKYNSEME